MSQNSVYGQKATVGYVHGTFAPIDSRVTELEGYLGYEEDDIYGISVDFENKTFERLSGAEGKTAGADFDDIPCFGGRRRCNVADDGTVNAYYGEEGYTEDGTNGQVMVEQPAFYYRVVPIVCEKNTVSGIGYHLRKANYYVTCAPRLGFKLHPAFYDGNGNAASRIFLSAYEGSMYDVSASAYVNDGTNTDPAIEEGDLLCSVAGKKPISGYKKKLTQTNLEVLAQNRGTSWHLETIQALSANQLLMMVELGTMNTQDGIGKGIVNMDNTGTYNCSSLTGSTSSLGNATGSAPETINEIDGVETAYSEDGKVSVSYRGVENPWGNLWKHVNGISVWGDGAMGGGQPYVASDFQFSEGKHDGNYKPVGFTVANSSGYINAMGYGLKDYDWLFIPSEIGGTSALPVGDYVYVTKNLSTYRIALLGGRWDIKGYAGGYCWSCAYNIGSSARNIGGRLLYIPNI